MVQRVASWLDATGYGRIERLLLVLGACALFLYVVRLLSRAVRRSLEAASLDRSGEVERRARTLAGVLENTARVLVIVFFVLTTLSEFRVSVGPLVAGAGIAGVALGFGAQSLVKDVIGGFFLLLENQFGVGDVIFLGDRHKGTVERMTLRMTRLRDGEGRIHYLPNGSISDVVVQGRDYVVAIVDVEVAATEDVDRVSHVLDEVGRRLHGEHPDWILAPPAVKGVEGMTAFRFTLRTLTRAVPGRQDDVARAFRQGVLARFRADRTLHAALWRVA